MSKNEITLEPTLVALAVESALEERAQLHWHKEESKKWVAKPKKTKSQKQGFLSRMSDFISRVVGN